ncbi:MAG: queuosine salvage family protein [bacterium]|nr:queuosine salvage family protein [bacterium]
MQLSDLQKLMTPKWVTVDEGEIERRAEILADHEFIIPDWQIENVLPKDHKVFLSWLPYLCAVDFAFTNFHRPYERFRAREFTGSVAMGHCFYRRFGDSRISASEMLRITGDGTDFEQFMRGMNGLPPLLEARRRNLREVADVMKRVFDDDMAKLLRLAKYKTCDLVEVLCSLFPTAYGSDFFILDREFIECLGERRVRLYLNKRANLLALMYQGRALMSGKALKPLVDGENLKSVTDAAVPNALRSMNILDYDRGLSYKIDHRQQLASGSREEVEIRLGTIYAVEMLLDRINELRLAGSKKVITMVELDYFLWQAGRECAVPPHLTKTTAY